MKCSRHHLSGVGSIADGLKGRGIASWRSPSGRLPWLFLVSLTAWFGLPTLCGTVGARQPNVILLMADDLGYGDTGFNGNKIVRTPNLDGMARDGVVLTHFYAGGPVCSPTRGTCLTGRHHFRYGIYSANVGHLPREEITLAQMLKSAGYTTGHFGKWHLGTLDRVISSKGKNRKPAANFAPPWQRDYDRSFVTESAVCLWNPGLGKRANNNPFYDDGHAVEPTDSSLLGGAARVVMDRAIPFIEHAVQGEMPFLAVIWFHAPHEDIQAGPDYLAMYPGHGEAAHYYGCITELDEQVGRLRQTLEKLSISDDTLLFFCSDNGPEGAKPKGRRAGTTKGLRGRKRSLYDGGVRVPALACWPGQIPAGGSVDATCSTLDYFPTIQQIVGYRMPDDRPVDGQDMMPLLTGHTRQRDKPIPFRWGRSASLVAEGYKFVWPAGELYDQASDYAEEHSVAAENPAQAAKMKASLLKTIESFQRSQAGDDYQDDGYAPVDSWRPLGEQPRN